MHQWFDQKILDGLYPRCQILLCMYSIIIFGLSPHSVKYRPRSILIHILFKLQKRIFFLIGSWGEDISIRLSTQIVNRKKEITLPLTHRVIITCWVNALAFFCRILSICNEAEMLKLTDGKNVVFHTSCSLKKTRNRTIWCLLCPSNIQKMQPTGKVKHVNENKYYTIYQKTKF